MRLGKLVFEESVRAKTNSLILGSPGFGKSRLLEHCQRQDLQHKRPFCFIDFHGSGYRNMLAWCAHNAYYDRDLYLLDLSEGRFAKGMNFFRRSEGIDSGVQTSGMVEGVLSAWGDRNSNSYPVIFRLLKVLFTVMVEKGIPLHHAIQLLSDRPALGALVEQVSDPLIRSLWGDLGKLPPSEWSRYVAPTINRLFRVVQSKSIQRFMCVDKKGFNLNLTFKDTILVNLATSDNLDADAAKTFGALLLNHLYLAAKRRKGKNGRDPSPYYTYVDEWILVGSPDYGRIAAETRKFGLLLVLANQDLSQIRQTFGGAFQESLLTLCQFQACFGGINDSDASRLAREWDVSTAQVKALRKRQCLIKLPRQAATLIKVPEVEEPFISPERVAQFERRIAERTGALHVEEVDERLHHHLKEKKELTTEDFIR